MADDDVIVKSRFERLMGIQDDLIEKLEAVIVEDGEAMQNPEFILNSMEKVGKLNISFLEEYRKLCLQKGIPVSNTIMRSVETRVIGESSKNSAFGKLSGGAGPADAK